MYGTVQNGTERTRTFDVYICDGWYLSLVIKMSGFTENALVKKLEDLNASQQSIQTLSLWLIHHRKHHQIIVKTWFRELLRG